MQSEGEEKHSKSIQKAWKSGVFHCFPMVFVASSCLVHEDEARLSRLGRLEELADLRLRLTRHARDLGDPVIPSLQTLK